MKRLFIGFSATAYFPGASAFDLKAQDFIDVPDAKGQVTFENVNQTTAISGDHLPNANSWLPSSPRNSGHG